ncbi:NHL domain-containing protein [Cohnella abietis]|uniref:SLH domain-containing protein n=1 Tax=Cohnella abietis TaxID=2507935 RepID=A0A3T1CZB7_9BACL|nr:InlB B-repeat-containing protein [Cohnella abietis]BBI31186.1 hypothetical protein KCTCHS21_05850 [Cohnella abietis]
MGKKLKQLTSGMLAFLLIVSMLPELSGGKTYAAASDIISTVAGSGEYLGDGGDATSAKLNLPTGVTMDSNGNLYIADYSNNRIRKVNTLGKISTVAGTGTAGFSGDSGKANLAKLQDPQGVAVDSAGNIYIADSFNNRIRKVDTSGEISTVAGIFNSGYWGDDVAATSTPLNRPTGVAVDSQGNLYIADSYNNRIRKVDTIGIISTVAGSSNVGGYTGDGAVATSAKLNLPTGVFVDSIGNLYIADSENHAIRKVDKQSGKISTVAGTGSAGFSGDGESATSAQLNSPTGVTVDSSGNLYIADFINHRIRKVDASGKISTVAGSSKGFFGGFSGDGGAATSAELNNPKGVAVDSSGMLYIADSNNNRIRKVGPPPGPTSYNITYNLDGGTATNPATYTAVDENFILTNPTKLGYTFAGWTGTGLGAATQTVTIAKGSTGDRTYTATWTVAANVTINYAANNTAYGSVSRSSEALNPEIGTASGSVATAKPGYYFVKWQDANSSQVSTSATWVPQKVSGSYVAGSYTAVFAPNSYNITYNLDGGTATNPATNTAEDDSFTLTNPTKPGYEFAGWTGTGLGAATQTVTIAKGSTGPRTYTATWTAKTYTVILNDNGGSDGSGSVNATYDQPMPTVQKPSKAGHAFVGYFDQLTGGTKYYNSDMSSARNWDKTASNVTLFASWSEHDVIGTIVDDGAPAQKIKGATVKIIKGNAQYGEATTDEDGKFTINNVSPGTYNLIMTIGDKTEIIAITVEKNKPITDLGVIIFPLGNASSALKFQGNGTPAVIIGNLHPEAEEYYNEGGSNFVKVEMTVAKTDEETAAGDNLTAINGIKTQAQSKNMRIGLYLDMTIEKFNRNSELDSWSYDGLIGQTKGLIKVIIPIPADLQGKSNYSVYRYHGNAVNIISTVPNTDGEYLIVDPSDWTLTLYVKNFSVYALAYNDSQSQQNPSGGATVSTITFSGNGGTPSSVTQSVTNGGLLSKPVDPVRKGYVFAGWYKADGSEWSFSSDRVNANFTLTAKWTLADTDTGIHELDKVNHFAYMLGYPDKTFGPEKNMTRAEATAMFARLLVKKMDVNKEYPTSFKDVAGTKWYANAIGYMEQYGIINGYLDGTFKPEAPITRAEFASIASRFDKLITGEPSTFSDVADNYWAKDNISFAAAKGWVKGYPDGAFKPNNNITRAEVVSLVNRMLERYSDKGYVDSNKNVLKQYVDLKNNYWAYYDIMEASNEHNYEKSLNSETWSR